MQNDLIVALGLASLEKGWVWLVGAGPGDPGLITALGLQALNQADVILYDALVDERLLTLSTAEKIYAGKRAGVRSCKQDEISQTLVALAKDGRRVLRLKGGDPFVFGRGGEEAQALARAGVPFRIVPGVTAGRGVRRDSGATDANRAHESFGASRGIARIDTICTMPPMMNAPSTHGSHPRIWSSRFMRSVRA